MDFLGGFAQKKLVGFLGICPGALTLFQPLPGVCFLYFRCWLHFACLIIYILWQLQLLIKIVCIISFSGHRVWYLYMTERVLGVGDGRLEATLVRLGQWSDLSLGSSGGRDLQGAICIYQSLVCKQCPVHSQSDFSKSAVLTHSLSQKVLDCLQVIMFVT